jgi:hypothetical protein
VNPALGAEGPAALVLTNSVTVAEGRVPNNDLDHVEDPNSPGTSGRSTGTTEALPSDKASDGADTALKRPSAV